MIGRIYHVTKVCVGYIIAIVIDSNCMRVHPQYIQNWWLRTQLFAKLSEQDKGNVHILRNLLFT
jgi:hypothetical protein